ncbi:BnaC06g18260D [Brassica napus]|uniref:BnaC06g18260D protein n=2 Tax=Brassica TaxID=3705 RepID=A0A078GIK1_BRANA|nr:BnaC06g18260D [Brassica napus]
MRLHRTKRKPPEKFSDPEPDKPGEEKSGGSCSWILVTLNAEKLGGDVEEFGKARRREENGDHDYVEYNNSSTTSPCQDHSPWLSA